MIIFRTTADLAKLAPADPATPIIHDLLTTSSETPHTRLLCPGAAGGHRDRPGVIIPDVDLLMPISVPA